MNAIVEMILAAVVMGIGATLVLDLWALIQKHFLGARTMSWKLVGRWVGHFPRGRFQHDDITAAAPVSGELALGWFTHYFVGVVYALLFLLVFGMGWARQPTLLPALGFGLLTVVAPFFIMQPGMGAGVLASRTPQPNAARLRSLLSHTVFGLGLYVAGAVFAWFAVQHA